MWQHIIIAQAPPEGGWIVQLLPFILIFGIFWLLVIRPQQKRHKQHQEYLNALKKGDKVVTAGGIFGTVEKVDEQTVTVRIARDTKIKVLRQQVEGSQTSYLSDGDEEETEEKAS
ncbi:preprotein translocase subunit YajC [Persicimonas caeni]|uniref:Preprotein translocase subunit YajC n=1 Tax=Persicimonas caeni TaxID=2292766 RepID=A0A4Y6Q3F5_PERCE|nr:preprotein translocase subunit YajC [Persicimonas caeni]QDG54535.1 preprotein translocase subunit YajC [Persicimonas caeni]QED35756.1 preprotein translocase subunit YajC [Persicimonas caeni]